VSNTFSTSVYVVGNIYASDYAVPTPAYLTTAVADMETAFTTANGLTTDVIVDLGAGDISGMTLAPGLYKYNTGLLITGAGVTLAGGPNDTWVFQISGDLTVMSGAIVTLSGGALAKNIFWVTATQAVLGTTVDFKGNILSQTLISLDNGASVLGRLLAQTGVTLIGSTVTKP
jgi:formylmethanofuran dehydrogenase subunit C